MERTINRNLLKYSAGRSIFCGQCDEIADCRRWVMITHNEDELAMCAPCWDKISKGRATPGFQVLDGRKVFSKKGAT